MAFFDVPDDWNGEDWSCYQLEWPASAEWRAIFNAMLRMATWYRNFDSTSGDVAAAVAVGDEIWRRWRLAGGQSDVGCNNDAILAALQAIAAGGCGGGSGGCGARGSGASEVAPDPGDYPPGSYPPEFPSESAFLDHKCDLASWIVSNMYEDFQFFANLSAAELLALEVGGLVLALLNPIPGDELLALIAILATVSAIGTGALDALFDATSDGYDDHICAIYDANNATDAKAALISSMEYWIDQSTANSLYRSVCKTLVGYYVTFDMVNLAFTLTEPYEDGYTGDCSGCTGPECEWYIVYGTGTIQTDGTSFQIIAEFDDATGYYQIGLAQTGVCCPNGSLVELVSVDSGSPNNGFGVYEWGSPCPTRVRIVTSSTPVISSWPDAQQISQTDNATFTMTFKITV